MKRSRQIAHPGSARLFADLRSDAPGRDPAAGGERSESAPPSSGVFLAHIDGASRGNPGPAAYALILRAPDGRAILELGKSIGRQTNNVAEYYALIAALDYAASHRISALRVRSDSELLVRQMQGRYKVKSAELRPLHERAQKLARGLAYFSIEHVAREANRQADRLANEALDRLSVRAAERTAGLRRAAPSTKADLKVAAAGSRQEKGTRAIRARYEKGVLVPSEPLDLPEGAEVEFIPRNMRNG